MADSAKSILIELLENGRHSRAALAQKLHRSRPAISTAVDKLISRGFLQEAGVAKSSGGKPPTMLEFTEKSLCAIGLTIGAENTMRSVLLDGNARIIAQLDKRFNNNISSIAAAAMESTAELRRRFPMHNIRGIGAAISGIVDTRSNEVVYSANFDIAGRNLAEQLSRECGLPVKFYNRVRAAAAAEWHGVKESEDGCSFYLNFQYGIGSVIHYPGGEFNGVNFAAGEVRELPVPVDGVYMPMEKAMQKIFAETGASDREECFRRYLEPCVHLLCNIASFIDPERIILDGNFKRLGRDFLNLLSSGVNSTMQGRTRMPEIRYGKPDSIGSAGGAALKVMQSELYSLKPADLWNYKFFNPQEVEI